MHACMYIGMHACMHACMHGSMDVCTYLCMHVRMYIAFLIWYQGNTLKLLRLSGWLSFEGLGSFEVQGFGVWASGFAI